eukprot:CAMPEP_0115366580 /NCGR_PEP_ID=MMETSP0270-20121206/104880_1 /TAXON_ID=71861 /ORGANISM="Scrippsiella trochoidea, Strain CCMP3099" /LENGTH=151 /DNA_ID=CAMNT_0002789359 /DNA_START=88 /DNA_END=543 /DNA_ORIENTATION=-
MPRGTGPPLPVTTLGTDTAAATRNGLWGPADADEDRGGGCGGVATGAALPSTFASTTAVHPAAADLSTRLHFTSAASSRNADARPCNSSWMPPTFPCNVSANWLSWLRTSLTSPANVTTVSPSNQPSSASESSVASAALLPSPPQSPSSRE